MTTSPAIACPQCATRMGVVNHDGVPVDVCACSGMWFDAGELAAWRAGKAAKPIVSRARGPTQLPCPRCPEQRLLAHTVATVPVHACPGCRGVFVPATSVARLEPVAKGASGAIAAEGVFGGLIELLANGLFLL